MSMYKWQPCKLKVFAQLIHVQLLAQGFSIYGPRARVQSALTTMEYVLSIERVQSMNRIFYEIEEASCQ